MIYFVVTNVDTIVVYNSNNNNNKKELKVNYEEDVIDVI